MPRKVFVAGEILTAADVNTNLMDQSVMVFDDATARTTAIPTPVEGMVTYLSDDDVVEVFNGASFVPVGPGQILQVASTNLATTFSASIVSGAGADVTGLSVSITPSSTSSKIMVLWNVVGSYGAGGVQASVAARIVRDSTQVGVGTVASRAPIGSGQLIVSGDNGDQFANASQVFLDSPSTTSATTYKIQIVNNGSATATLFVNRSVTDVATYGPAAMSSITVMEVAG